MVITLNVSSQSQLELSVFEKINDYRVENGLKELKWDDDTYKSTRIHTVYMINEGELSHAEKLNFLIFPCRKNQNHFHDFSLNLRKLCPS